MGSRPHETAAIRYGDCKVDKRPDGKVKGIIYISPLTKRGKRTAIMNGNTLRKVQSHLRKGIKLRNEQIEQTNKMIQDELSGVSLAKHEKISSSKSETGLIDLRDPVSNDDPLMMNPFLRTKERKMYHRTHSWLVERYIKAMLFSGKLYSLFSAIHPYHSCSNERYAD